MSAAPLLHEHEADPGGPGPFSTWNGPVAWRRRRGSTVVTYFRGVARHAAPVLGSDGTASEAARILDGLREYPDETPAWAPMSGPDTCVAGHLVFVADGPARFVRDAGQAPKRVTDLELALAASLEIAVAVRDLKFAQALYAALADVTWHGPAGARFPGSYRRADGIVAALRRRGEEPGSFFGSAPETVVRPDVAAALASLGWRPRTEADRAADAVRLQALLAEWTARPAFHVRPWSPPSEPATGEALDDPTLAGPAPPTIQRHDTIAWLAASARVSAEEYTLAWELDDDRCCAP